MFAGPNNPELVRDMPIEAGQSMVMHRYMHLEHEDSMDCWCEPIVWSFDQVKLWPLERIQARLDRFLRMQ